MNYPLTCLLLTIFVCTFVGCFHLRGGSANLVTGQLVDAQGSPLAGVELQVEAEDGKLGQELLSSEDGSFELSFLLDKIGQRVPLSSGISLKISAWKKGLEPRELSLTYLGGRMRLEPLILRHDPLRTEALPLPTEEPVLRTAAPLGGSRSGRGE